VKTGRLIALEGLDGCGKSTQQERIARALRAEGYSVVVTREPTDGPWGRRIRAMAGAGEAVAPEEELRCFLEDRARHVAETIAPALRAGRIVLTDRYTLSSVAYQGARGLAWREILAEGEARFPVPDLVLLFDVTPELGLARVAERGGPREARFESRPYLEEVAAIFAAIDRPYVERIDANREPDAITEDALCAIRAVLGEA
jgi:dTMP kinase